MTTIVDKLQEAFEDVHDIQGSMRAKATAGGEPAREFAIAKTAIEDAIMRVNRGFALLGGRFVVADVQKTLAEEAGDF